MKQRGRSEIVAHAKAGWWRWKSSAHRLHLTKSTLQHDEATESPSSTRANAKWNLLGKLSRSFRMFHHFVVDWCDYIPLLFFFFRSFPAPPFTLTGKRGEALSEKTRRMFLTAACSPACRRAWVLGHRGHVPQRRAAQAPPPHSRRPRRLPRPLRRNHLRRCRCCRRGPRR